MSRSIYPILGLTLTLSVTGCAIFNPEPLTATANELDVANIRTLEFSGTGHWYQFGQAPNPSLPWPDFELSSYTADINYVTSSARVQTTRKQIIEPDRQRPVPTEQKADQYINGNTAWNLARPANAAPDAAPVASAQPTAVEERAAEIWSTPQGFLRAAQANNAKSKTSPAGTEVSFTVGGKYRYIGTLNSNKTVARVQTWIDNPVLGDTLVETKFLDYQVFDGVKFPSHIVRSIGGHPVLDLNVTKVKTNLAAELPVPDDIVSAKPAAVTVKADKLATGVYYLTGGTHHSVAIEQNNHVVVVEAPQNEERSLAVIAKVKELFPNKAIKFLINTHAHFDHSGGLRTFVDEGSTIVTEQSNQPYYEKVWSAPRTLNPDRLAKSKKPAKFETFTDKILISDGSRKIEVHSIAGNSHNDAFALVYLPKEKILIEADAYTPPAANAPAPTSLNPYTVNLYDNIQKLNLDVDQIAALHGPRVVKLDDLKKALAVK